jgi:pantoate--beta-alanine ligase
MGYLHDGHLSLVQIARNFSDSVVVSIFVNPTQFGPNEDLDKYPQDFDGDKQRLLSVRADAIFYPNRKEMYPEDYETFVEMNHLPNHLCGRNRPTHFRGVTTVVSKLFNTVRPHIAVFGEKDFQQLQIIRKMTRDLDYPIEIIAGPTLRESDGLAMSSRNSYLTSDERRRAICLYMALQKAKELCQSGERQSSAIINGMKEIILQHGGEIDYVSIVDPVSLDDVSEIINESRACLAVKFGRTRLIDNCPLP